MADLYRRRWRIEDAFSTVKRLLGLSYLWTGSLNGIQLPISETYLFYAVLMDLGDTVADSLYEPIDFISLERIYPGLYPFYVAYHKGKATDPIEYFLTPENQDLGVVKQQRKPNIKLIVAPFPDRPLGCDQFFARGIFWNPLDNCHTGLTCYQWLGCDQFFARGIFWNPLDNCHTGLTCYQCFPPQNINFCKFKAFILKNSIIEYRK